MDSSNSEYTLSSELSSLHREASIYGSNSNKSDNLDVKAPNNSDRKNSASSAGSGSHSFTQRLIDRGVAVPSSFSNWEKLKASDDAFFSPGSFDFDSHYGMSPFITPSFSTTTAGTADVDGSLYKSLKHRYEKERVGNSSARIITDDEDDAASSSATTASPLSALQCQKKKQRAEDSDIELSDEEDASMTLEKLQLPLAQRSRRSRSPLSFPPTNVNSTASATNTSGHAAPAPAPPPDGIFDLMKPQNYQDMYEEAPKLSPSVQKIKHLLTTAPPLSPSPSQPAPLVKQQQQQQQPTKPLPNPPRQHLLHTPVFQVVNANTVKDRYLFLFNDLLLICKPIMDENIIVSSNSSSNNSGNRHGSSSHEKNRYRFRPNEHSLFQVKNIVQLGLLTLYISKDDFYHAPNAGPTTIEMGPDGRPILPPARKIHPIMASALRKFETNANLGIQYLIDKGVLTNDPLSIANFLFKTPDLNRRQLGYYLSDLKNSDVYDAFLECFRLVGLRLDEALRILLTTFRLPSNWEALEYLIERFAKKWHDANQNVIKFHEDMVVKVVVAMLFLNAECWYDATSERDVFWYARELKERQDRQAKRKMSVIDYQRPNALQKPSSSATTSRARQSVAVEPLHYIMSLRARGNSQPTLDDFLERWNYYDQYHLVPREFMEEMYKSIGEERLETGWDNKTGRRIQTTTQENNAGVGRPKIVSPSVQQGSQDVVITVIPHRLPTRLTKGLPSNPISISIPAPDAGLQIKLRGQDLVFEPNVLDFSQSCIQTFTITGNTLGRTSLMFIKTGDNAGNYVSPTLPRTKSVVVERPFMRYTFQVGFKHVDHEKDKKKMLIEEEEGTRKKEDDTNIKSVKKSRNATRRNRDEKDHEDEDGGDDEDEEAERQAHMVNRKYTFSVETEEERIEWLEALKRLSGHVNEERNQKSIAQLHNMSSEARVALQVLKEVLLADEVKKGTARTTTTSTTTTSTTTTASNNNNNNNNTSANVNKINTTTNTTTSNNSNNATTATTPLEYDDPNNRHGRTMRLLLPAKKKKEDDRSSIKTTATSTSTTANVVTKRGHEIVKLVVQNSMVPLVLGFLKSQIPTDQ
ncbi:SEC7-like protein [Mucor ambiguus]|uniref:SEC7-like protein n=1 Tax=Mucor ambiguus TaxID=91626 RepID=A0A0C9N145_9FUNG|nr:SEC7-like protein [Mucor ambiguus]